MNFFKIRWALFLEEVRGLWFVRHFPQFLLLDLILKILGNPYRICSSYLKKQGFDDVHVYGETPIRSFAKLSEIVRGRAFVDLGCGRGRLVFYAALVLGCQAKGIEHVPGLMRRAKLFSVKRASFSCMRIEDVSLAEADVVYLAGTCMEKEVYEETLQTMRPGAILLSVSEPVLKGFELQKKMELPFHFGSSTVYVLNRTLLPAADKLINNT